MKVRELRQIRSDVAAARCPECNTIHLEIQEIHDRRVSVLCPLCGWFTAEWPPTP